MRWLTQRGGRIPTGTLILKTSMLACLLALMVFSGDSSAQGQGELKNNPDIWSGSYVLREVIAVQQRGIIELIIATNSPDRPLLPAYANPAECPNDGLCTPRNGALDGESCRTDVYVDLPVIATTPEEGRQVKLLTDTALAAFATDRRVSVLVDGINCSEDGRRIAKGLRIEP